MKCPACGNELSPLTAGDVEVDVCRGGCGGVWFDKDEIDRFDERHEFSGSALFGVERNPDVKPNLEGPRQCPRCEDQVLIKQFFDVHNQIQADQCWECSGIWLDVGELQAIRSQYQTAAERRQAVNAFVDGCMTEHLKAVAESGREKMAVFGDRHKNVFAAFANELRQLLQGEDDVA